MSKHFFNPSVKSITERHDFILGGKIDKLSLNNDGVEDLLTSLDGKMSKGQDVKVAGSDLQQVLMYGRNNDGTLHPLESVGDRLIVDVMELSPTGPHTPTSLPSIAIHGQVEGTNGFKNLQVNTVGELAISQLSHRSVEFLIVLNSVISASAQIGGNIDISTKKSILIYGSATGNHSVFLEHSMDNTNFFLHSEITPVSHGATYHYNVKIENGLKFYRLVNSNTGNTFSLSYVTL
tara:strand:- start:2508 stop:3212 length:705 start_codon:yes stop_codon:yes gene_type:complete